MRKILIKCAIGAGCLLLILLAWISAGQKLSLLLDRFKTVRIASLPVSPLVFEGLDAPGSLQIGNLPMSTQLPNYKPSGLRLESSERKELVLVTGGKSFTLGPIVFGKDISGSGIEFEPDPKDKVSFEIDRSLLSWPTPFDFNFMTGQSTSWRRNLYYRLAWEKPSGAKLEMVWRYEQYFYAANGWASGFMTREGFTGLIRVDVSP